MFAPEQRCLSSAELLLQRGHAALCKPRLGQLRLRALHLSPQPRSLVLAARGCGYRRRGHGHRRGGGGSGGRLVVLEGLDARAQ